MGDARAGGGDARSCSDWIRDAAAAVSEPWGPGKPGRGGGRRERARSPGAEMRGGLGMAKAHLCPLPPSPAPASTSGFTSAVPPPATCFARPSVRPGSFFAPGGGCQLALAAFPRKHNKRRNNNPRRGASAPRRRWPRTWLWHHLILKTARSTLRSVWRGRPRPPCVRWHLPATHTTHNLLTLLYF